MVNDVTAPSDDPLFPMTADHALLSEHLSQFVASRQGQALIALLIADVGSEITEADFALTLRRCNFSFRHFEFACAETGSGSGFLIASDKSRFISDRDFQSIIMAIRSRFAKSSLLIISCENGTYTVSEDGQREGGEPALDYNPTSAFTDIVEHIGRWKGNDAKLLAIIAGYDARSRRSLGFMSGWAVELNRKKLIRATMPW